MLKRLNQRSPVHAVPVVPIEPTIPRVLHQTIRTGSVHPDLQHTMEQNRLSNPDWEYRLFRDEDICDFIRDEYGNGILETYLRLDPAYGAARADLFRYLLVYRAGGVYLDAKSASMVPLDDVLEPTDQFLISQWRNKVGERYEGAGIHKELTHIPGGAFQQWFIITSPGHPFLAAVIENTLRNIAVYDPLLHGVGGRGVFRLTGPITYTLAIEPILLQHPHRFVDAEDDLGLLYSGLDADARGAHKSLSGPHYSTLLDPIVIQRGRYRHLGPVIRLTNRIRHRVERR